MNSPDTAPSPRTQIRRVAAFGRYDRETIRSIIDAAWHCHVSFADEAVASGRELEARPPDQNELSATCR